MAALHLNRNVMPTQIQINHARRMVEEQEAALRSLDMELVQVKDAHNAELEALTAKFDEDIETFSNEVKRLQEAAEKVTLQVQEARSSIVALEQARTERLEVLRAKWESASALLLEEKADLETHLFREKACFAPIRRVPREILGLIFVEYIRGGGEPTDLLEVCVLWDQVADTVPSLWRSISVGDNLLADAIATVAELEEALRRVGSLSIDVSLRLGPSLIYGSHPQTINEHLGMIKLLAENMHRWRSVALIGLPKFSDQNFDILVAFSQALDNPLPILEKFDVGPHCWIHPLIPKIFKNALRSPKLVSLALCDISAPVVHNPDLVRIQDLRLCPTVNAQPELPNLVRQFTGVQSLILDNNDFYRLFRHNPLPAFPYLEQATLNMTAFRPFDRNQIVDLSRLVRLILASCHKAGNFKVIIHAPVLTHLIISGRGIDIFPLINAPRLTTLELVCKDLDKGVLNRQLQDFCLAPEPFPRITSCRMSVGMGTTRFRTIMETLKYLEELILVDVWGDKVCTLDSAGSDYGDDDGYDFSDDDEIIMDQYEYGFPIGGHKTRSRHNHDRDHGELLTKEFFQMLAEQDEHYRKPPGVKDPLMEGWLCPHLKVLKVETWEKWNNEDILREYVMMVSEARSGTARPLEMVNCLVVPVTSSGATRDTWETLL